jgi:hypothetical protein
VTGRKGRKLGCVGETGRRERDCFKSWVGARARGTAGTEEKALQAAGATGFEIFRQPATFARCFQHQPCMATNHESPSARAHDPLAVAFSPSLAARASPARPRPAVASVAWFGPALLARGVGGPYTRWGHLIFDERKTMGHVQLRPSGLGAVSLSHALCNPAQLLVAGMLPPRPDYLDSWQSWAAGQNAPTSWAALRPHRCQCDQNQPSQ